MVQKLRVSDNGRRLTQEDGQPFFWLGDTAWELFHKLNREEAEHYLRTRANQRFNVVQAVALAELDGLETANAYGKRPLSKNEAGEYDPSLPLTEEEAYDYWKHVDYIIDFAAELGIYIALLPTWGDKYNLMWGKGPVVFNAENANAFGRWLGARYSSRSNIVWVLGGDRPLTEYEHFAITRALAAGIKEGGAEQLMTLHPMGGHSSSYHVHRETWLDFNMIQSGHGEGVQRNYEKVLYDYGLTPVKPTMDAEPCYEDHPVGFRADNGYFDQSDVRKAAYYGVLSGACGHTYGHHSVWCMSGGQYGSLEFDQAGGYVICEWKAALERPGANQMKFVLQLLESKGLEELIPDQELLEDSGAGSNYVPAARGNTFALYYSPNGLSIHARLGRLSGQTLSASWYNPRSGEFTNAGILSNEGTRRFMPPSSGRGEDWILVLAE
ncbi:glycoside hydrolase family 140 protein [Paenibacillus glycanilyticus]|uniref:glycoside hydrolase family 140 protein n=1 Tax=Paenibacillus glycanilyticus TaxID=126569 RepID=UPI003EC07632